MENETRFCYIMMEWTLNFSIFYTVVFIGYLQHLLLCHSDLMPYQKV